VCTGVLRVTAIAAPPFQINRYFYCTTAFWGSKGEEWSLPFQIGVAGSRFAKPFVKISKSGSHLLMDDCPTNWKL
jgi:hypothetical protein